ncbi:2-isopropylmalate synthase [Xenorhabdus bovienii]|uniref:2-isopropylmalate synthase n=1 Tax=Xenorhabdus bovienii TaxID=40576 RepID=UPI000170B4DC|nr:2-isopropylmalate synthase [Xenorhabdus bovienii]CDG89192.1 2-isopropylmalate synthase [Xenorhabdus bovienii str. feltiae France]CDG94876.1 2-isopropylmalate synthase [Xenorhabdus bovienii str. feltiae Florida]
MSQQVIIFDTTLRDGEQALQASLSVKEKLQIAYALERLGVDIIEAGFPVSSPGDFESVQTIAREIKNSRICALSRCVDNDIDVAAEALKVAEAFRLHLFLATSSLHVEHKLKKEFDDVVEMAVRSIKRARKYTDDIEFSCEDAGRSNIDNLCHIVEQAIKAGATTINIPDTVGYTTPYQFGGIIQNLFDRVPNIDKAIISVHCHDDLGMSVANSITAVQAGARQIEGTINGLGERAGNCSLEEVIMAIKTRQQILGVHTNINHKEIYRTSQLVSQICNTPIPANKAIVGSNAFAHSSGIHQDGVLKNRETYEIMTPESIGLKDTQLNLTSRSGRAAVKHRMSEMGYQEQDYNLDTLYKAFLRLADKKGQVFDYDLEALVFINQQQQENEHYRLDYFSTQSGTNIVPTATVRLACGDEIKSEAATGNGTVDAIYQAINRITGYSLELISYQLTGKGHGKDALGQVNIIVEHSGRRFHGMGLETDIIESSAKAMIPILNSIWQAEQVEKEKQRIQSNTSQNNFPNNNTKETA